MIVSRNVRLLACYNFFTDFRPYTPVFILYFAQQTGSYTLAMALLSVWMISSSVFEVPTGLISDLLGRTQTMMLAGLAGAVQTLLWAIGGSFWVLALGSLFAGLSRALMSGNNEAFLHATLAQAGRGDEYSHFLGRTSAFLQVGLGTSAVLGGILAQWSLSAAMWAGIFPQLACVVLTFWMIEPRVHDDAINANVFNHLRESFRRFRDNPRLRALSLASMLNYGLAEAQFYFMPLFFASLWPLWAVGLVRSFAHAMATLSFWFSGGIIKRLEPFTALILSKAASHVLAIAAYASRSLMAPMLVSSLSLFFGVKTVAENTLLQREFTDAQRATMGSITQFGGSIVYAVSALGLGLLADRVGIAHTLILSELTLFVGILLYGRAFRKT